MKKPITHSNQTSASGTYDIPLMFPVLFLVGIGIVMVYTGPFRPDRYIGSGGVQAYTIQGIPPFYLPSSFAVHRLSDCCSHIRVDLHRGRIDPMDSHWKFYVSALRICPVFPYYLSRVFFE